MNSISFQCCFCGELQETVIEQTTFDGGFIVDCDNCCRPMRVNVHGGDDAGEGEFFIEVEPS